MIGNMMVSPRIRPQTFGEQYITLQSFPERYMLTSTKTAIDNMMKEIEALKEGEVSTAGLQNSRRQTGIRCGAVKI